MAQVEFYSCECCNKINVKILLPAGKEMGELKVYGLNEDDKIVSEYTPGCIEDDWDSSDDEDYVSSSEEDDPYEYADLTDADREELRLELASILADK